MNDIYDMPRGQALMLYGPGAHNRALRVATRRGIGRILGVKVAKFTPPWVRNEILRRGPVDVLIIEGLPTNTTQKALLMTLVKNVELMQDGRILKCPRVIVCANQGTVPTMALEDRRFIVEYCDA